MWIIGAVLIACLLVPLGILIIASPGKPRPLTDPQGRPLAGALVEKTRVRINGVEQGMFIQSTDVSHPVLLYLHGGMPDYFLTQQFPTGLEKLFTVVWWEQRGTGLSYSAEIAPDSITSEQLIADTLALTDYLRQRFGQDRVYLMGHSGGTFIGIQAAARAPERYHAYIGVAQMSNQLASEHLAYTYMLAQFRAAGNASMVRKLEAAPVTLVGGVPRDYLRLRDVAMHSLGVGTTRNMRSVITGVFVPSLLCRDYTLAEKLNLWRGKAASGVSPLWNEMIATDLAERTPALSIPVYLLHGTHDYTCSYTEARAYFDRLDAPVKGFYTFAASAHSPMFEESGKMLTILREDVLQGANALADAD